MMRFTPPKRIIKDIKRILQQDRLPTESREGLFALLVKTKGRMGWL